MICSGGVVEPVLSFELLGDCLSQLGYSRCRCVLCVAGLEGLDCGILDVIGSIEIRRPGAETDNVNTLGLEFLCTRRNGDGRRRRDFLGSYSPLLIESISFK